MWDANKFTRSSEKFKSVEGQPRDPIPLQIPLCKDPRFLSRAKLIKELEKRKMSVDGSRDLLAARLYNVVRFKERLNIDPRRLNDEQPEKWMVLMSLYEREYRSLESNPDVLRKVHADLYKDFLKVQGNREQMMKIANADRPFPDQSDLYNAMFQFYCSSHSVLSVYDLYIKHGVDFTASICIFKAMNGCYRPPECQVEVGVLQQEKLIGTTKIKYAKKERKTPEPVKYILLTADGTDAVEVSLGQELSLPTASGEKVEAAMVIRVDNAIPVVDPYDSGGGGVVDGRRAKKARVFSDPPVIFVKTVESMFEEGHVEMSVDEFKHTIFGGAW